MKSKVLTLPPLPAYLCRIFQDSVLNTKDKITGVLALAGDFPFL